MVGAGPAGVAAAVTLAAAGRDVTMIDKAVFPRDKCCGDGLTTLALRELETLGFDPGQVADWQPVDGAVLRSPSGREVTVPLPPGPGTFAAVVPRLQLDAALVETAVKAGVTVITGAGFDGELVERADHVVVGVAGRDPISARYVVAADGMWSPVRKAAGLTPPGYLGEWHAFRQYGRRRHRIGARPPPRLVRARLPPRIRLVVPAARRSRQPRLRRACATGRAGSRT